MQIEQIGGSKEAGRGDHQPTSDELQTGGRVVHACAFVFTGLLLIIICQELKQFMQICDGSCIKKASIIM